MKGKFKLFLLFTIALLAFFLRIWHLEELFVFGFDEEVIAFRAKQLIVHHKPFLIGGVTPFNIHLGPAFYYLSSLFLLWPWRLNPLSWGVWTAVISTLTIFLIFWVGKKMFNQRVGFFAAFFQAFSFYQILFDRHYWPLFPDPLLSLLTIFSLWQIINQKINWIFILALVLSLSWQTDPSTAPLFILVILAWLVFSLPVKHKKTFLALLLFFLSFLPLLVFDLRHKGSNLAGLKKLSTVERKFNISGEKLVDTLIYVPHGLGKLILTAQGASYQRLSLNNFGFKDYLATPLAALVLFYLLRKTFRKKEVGSKLLGFLTLITFSGIFLYGNLIGFDLWNHYLAILFPVFFLSLALLIDRIWRGLWYIFVPLLLLFFITLNLRWLYFFKRLDNFKDKMQAVVWTKEVLGTEDFALDSLSRDFRYNGVRYLFYLAGKEPALSFVDQPLFWLYDRQPADSYPKRLVVFVLSDFTKDQKQRQYYQQLLNKKILSKSFGELEVLIIDNEEKEFTLEP